MKKYFTYLLGTLCGVCIMIALLITSVEAVTYWNPGFYEKEYEKHQVLNEVSMEMDDLLQVTQHMLSYLKGDHDDLQITTVVNGESREFFNERELAHMVDVKGLFTIGISIRRITLFLAFFCVGGIYLLKRDYMAKLPKLILSGAFLFFAFATGLGVLVSTDFSRYFVLFHELFFTNDLWILDPKTDLLINIVPEGFFMDTAFYIGLTFLLFSIVLLFGCLIFILLQKKKKNSDFTCPKKSPIL